MTNTRQRSKQKEQKGQEEQKGKEEVVKPTTGKGKVEENKTIPPAVDWSAILKRAAIRFLLVSSMMWIWKQYYSEDKR